MLDIKLLVYYACSLSLKKLILRMYIKLFVFKDFMKRRDYNLFGDNYKKCSSF